MSVPYSTLAAILPPKAEARLAIQETCAPEQELNVRIRKQRIITDMIASSK